MSKTKSSQSKTKTSGWILVRDNLDLHHGALGYSEELNSLFHTYEGIMNKFGARHKTDWLVPNSRYVFLHCLTPQNIGVGVAFTGDSVVSISLIFTIVHSK